MKKSSELRKRIKSLTELPSSEALTELSRLSNELETEEHWVALGRAINSLTLNWPQVKLLGSCTLDYLCPLLASDLWVQNVPFQVTVGGYDQTLQELECQVEHYAVLVPWRETIRDLESELSYWQRCWQIAETKGIRLVQVSYDWIRPDSSGHRCERAIQMAELNLRLRDSLPSGHFFLELDQISGLIGRKNFYDFRSYYWTKQPFSSAGLKAFSSEVAAGLRTLLTGPKKVLVLDLDNTLWGGEVGDTGPFGIELEGPQGEAYLAFQRYLKSLKEQGTLLAIASKNEESVVLDAFAQNTQLVLKIDDFVAWEIHWGPKSQSLINIAQKLNLSLDSFVFFDDNPRERAEVSGALPDVHVVEVSRDPVDYVDDLQTGRHFETLEITQVDRSRTEQYKQNALRSQRVGTLEEHLASLDMAANLEPLGQQNLGRMVQLLARSNQFNLTTRRHGPEDLKRFSEIEGAYVRSLSLSDQFGDLGIISVMIAIPVEPAALRIETWVMSCRALQRTVEFYFFDDLIAFAKSLGRETIWGEYLPTPKNVPVSKLYSSLGFKDLGDGRFQLSVREYVPNEFYVR